MTDKLAIYGAGGFAKEVAWLTESLSDQQAYDIVAFLEDGEHQANSLRGIPILSLSHLLEQHPDALITIAVGNSLAREQIATRCQASARSFATVIHGSVHKSDSVSIGEGSIVSCGSILTVDVEIGRHVAINTDCTIAHDVTIGDYATLSPGVHVSGNVKIGRGVFIGTGASIVNGSPSHPIVIGDYCVIAAGACVTSNTIARCLYAGVPAVFKKNYEQKN